MIPAIHLAAKAKLNETHSRAFRLIGTPSSVPLTDIAATLDVEHSARYQPTATQTFCNIYAYDLCCLAGVYLPRVWWTPAALKDLESGSMVLARYGDTVTELNANALYRWLISHGPAFGWHQVATLNELQSAANSGQVCLISAMQRDPKRSGHISCVLPEGPDLCAVSRSGLVTAPVQSQAGVRNYQRSVLPGRWWEKPSFAASGFFVSVP